jgi:hypothetical protein
MPLLNPPPPPPRKCSQKIPTSLDVFPKQAVEERPEGKYWRTPTGVLASLVLAKDLACAILSACAILNACAILQPKLCQGRSQTPTLGRGPNPDNIWTDLDAGQTPTLGRGPNPDNIWTDLDAGQTPTLGRWPNPNTWTRAKPRQHLD